MHMTFLDMVISVCKASFTRAVAGKLVFLTVTRFFRCDFSGAQWGQSDPAMAHRGSDYFDSRVFRFLKTFVPQLFLVIFRF